MKKGKTWLRKTVKTVTPTKHFLANLSIVVRTSQFNLFKKLTKSNKKSKVLDVGTTSNEVLKDSNLFEKLYEFKNNLTAATIEDVRKFRKLYPDIKTVKIYPKKELPFKNKSFDVATSWATVEHVGEYSDQQFFINELLRVSKKVFITTPYRGCFYEPHTGILLLQWLPLSIFRRICRLLGKDFWANPENLNPLYVGDIRRMKLIKKVKVQIYYTLNILPTHIIISN